MQEFFSNDTQLAKLYPCGMHPWAKRLNDSVREVGWTKAELSRRSKVSYDSINKYLRGEVEKPRGNIIDKLAKALGVSAEWLLLGKASVATIPIVGYIGAGAEFHAVDDFSHGDGLDYIDAPPGSPSNAVAVQVRGESMTPVYMDGDILVYWQRRTDIESFLNRRCVVGLEDGRILVKTLVRGAQSGLYTLMSFNSATIPDVAVEWCAKIEWVQPR